MREEIAAQLRTLPDAPGVYLMKDAGGAIFYVGKAKSLRDRVRAYFSGSDTRAFVALLDRLLADLEVVLVASEKEALLLENELIKAHRPRFNVKLNDDKRFLRLRLDPRQRYPRLEVVRRHASDGARYFGPYDSAAAIRKALRLVNRHFQLRTCSDQVLRQRQRPCLQYQIKRCPAPCVIALPEDSYASNVRAVIAFLEGRSDAVVAQLTQRIEAAAAELAFEQAALLRDQLRAVERSIEHQAMVNEAAGGDQDVVGIYREGPTIEVHVMQVRGGRLSDARRFSLADTEVPTQDVLADFAGRYYADADNIPSEILFPGAMLWAEPLGQVLAERSQRPVRVMVPQRGHRQALVAMACRNAAQAFADKRRAATSAEAATEGLMRALRLTRLPVRIECFDVSHLQGSHTVASQVAFDGGVAAKERYRRYKIRAAPDQDDYQALYEVLVRRARRGLEEDDLPDLMVIDGGRGQLAAARAALDDHGIDTVDLISLAKATVEDPGGGGRRADRGARAGAGLAPLAAARFTPDRVFVGGQKDPVVLRANSAELFLLTRARDEAHRFAVAYHRQARRRASTTSWLDGVDGIGPKRRQALLKTFGSLAGVRQASADAIVQVVGARAAVDQAKKAE